MDTEENIKITSSFRSTFEIILLYYFIGFLWIIFSDRFLKILNLDQSLLDKIEVFKGIFYVVVSGIFFYYIIKRRMDIYVNTIDNLKNTTCLLKDSNQKKVDLEQKLFNLAYFDELTGLPNKLYLEQKISEQIEKHPDTVFGIFCFDIDDFRNINELHGHDVGDELIVEVAGILQSIESESTITARHNADEFLVALLYDSKEKIEEILNYNLSNVRKSFIIKEDNFFITISGGVAFYPDDGNTFKDIFISADIAMSEAKNKGKDAIVYFTDKMRVDTNKKIEIFNLLHQAIEKEEFNLYYQPIVNIYTGEVLAVEALIRWFSQTKGYIPPMDFIPLAELSDTINDITKWVFIEAIKTQNKLKILGYDMIMSINLSARSLTGDKFVNMIKELVLELGVNPKKIEFEITETAIISDVKESTRVLNILKKMGFAISIDDFGTGYSSLSYLNKLPLNILKIDRSFVNKITKNEDSPVVEFMVNIANQLKLDVIVEGIETIAQLDIIKGYGCKYAQGYLFSKPLSEAHLIEYLNDEKKRTK